jgi:oligopeptide transport system ATP-binding protein
MTAVATTAERPLLEVKNLSTQFQSEDGIVKAVNDVSFHIMPGETLGVVGESGSGKSITALSILRLIADPPGRIVSGEVLLDGVDLLKLPNANIRDVRGAKIGMIFQDPMTSLNPVLTVSLQITETLRRHTAMTRQQAQARALEMLQRVGIPNAEQRLREYPHQFSGGMRQRVMIAMALSCNPRFVIADEPTSALDVTVQAQILDLMHTIQVKHRTGIMMITHSMGVVAGIADRVQVMYAGSIVETAPTEEMFANPCHPYTVGLMSSIPRLDERKQLRPIPGLPPDLADLPAGCAFAPRCSYAQEKCLSHRPQLVDVGPDHRSACWYWQEVRRPDATSTTRARQ